MTRYKPSSIPSQSFLNDPGHKETCQVCAYYDKPEVTMARLLTLERVMGEEVRVLE